MADRDAKTETGPKRPNDGPPGFRAFWAAYPRKVQKGPALKAWLALSRQGVPFEDIAEAAREYAKASQAKGTPPDRIQHPATFLHEDRWRDWLPPDGASYLEALRLAERGRASPPTSRPMDTLDRIRGLSYEEAKAVIYATPDPLDAIKRMSFEESKAYAAGKGLHVTMDVGYREIGA
ncbi:MAG: hypothetical protein IJR14_06950 [Synergistaceae bacterium]|nr:hypothetical protein [Synergistaceae bacterium]